MKVSAVAGKRARLMTNIRSKESLIAILPIILTARASIVGIYPFGVAAFAALMPSPIGIIALTAGSLTIGIQGIKYILCGLIYYGLCYFKKIDRISGTAAVSAIVVFASVLEALFAEPTAVGFLSAVAEGVCAGCLYYIFASLRRTEGVRVKTKDTRERIAAQLILIGGASVAFSGIAITQWIDVGLLFALLFSMLISGSVELSKGITAATVISFIYMLSGTASLSAVSIFVTSALLTALLTELGKWGVVLGYLVGSAVVIIFNDLVYDARLYVGASLVTVLIYSVTPQFLLDRIGEKIRDAGAVYDTKAESERIEKRIKMIIKEHSGITAGLKKINDALNDTEKTKKSALYSLTTAVAQRADGRSGVSGDCFLQFEAEGGRSCAILCDGMGSGKKAYGKSKMTARLLREFLKAGFLKEKSLEMLNTALAVNGDEECFSTVDLFEFNTYTGDAVFLKIGSAESFVRHNGEIDVLISSGLPVGILEDVSVEPKTVRLNTGDVIVMISDGVGEAGYGVIKNEWIKRMIKSAGTDMQGLAEEILAEAVRRNYPDKDDDMTVAAIRIDRAKQA